MMLVDQALRQGSGQQSRKSRSEHGWQEKARHTNGASGLSTPAREQPAEQEEQRWTQSADSLLMSPARLRGPGHTSQEEKTVSLQL